MRLLVLSFLAFVCVNFGTCQLPPANEVEFFILGLRHGARNPGKFLPGDTSWQKWAIEGANQLTKVGKYQAYHLGQFLRERYASLVPDEFYPDHLKAYSASAERCQQSLQSALAGFYPASGGDVWNDTLLWNPIPYLIDDTVLHLRDLECPYYSQLYAGYTDGTDKNASEWLNRDPALVKYLSDKTKWNATLDNLANIADNVASMKLVNYQLPDWVTKPDLPGYPPKDMTAAIATFGWGPRFLCLQNDECIRMTGGTYLNHFLNTLKGAHDRSKLMKEQKATIYTSNLETTSSLIKLMKVDGFAPSADTFAYIVELSKNGLRFFYITSDETNPGQRDIEKMDFSFCKGQDWCPYDTFLSNVKDSVITDWQAACKIPSACPPSGK